MKRRRYLGIDLHSDQATVHELCVQEDGTLERHNRRYTLPEIEYKLLPTMDRQCWVCLESGSGSMMLARKIREADGHVILLHAQDLRLVYSPGRKTDRIDARKLANHARRRVEDAEDETDVAEVHVIDETTQELRSLISFYDQLNVALTAIRNRMYAIFRQQMVATRRSRVIAEFEVLSTHESISGSYRFILDQLMAQYKTLCEQKNRLRERIIAVGVGRFRRDIELLISVSGISVFTAVVIMSDVVTIDRFKNRKKLTSYLRSAPRVDASNNTVRIGRINKRGRKRSFNMLLLAVNHLRDGNSYLQGYNDRVVGKPRNKIRAALVGKTITIIFYVLKTRTLARQIAPELYRRKLKEVDHYALRIAA